jgi:hypothetical protein
MKRRLIFFALLMATAGSGAFAQKVAVKEDLLYGAGTLTPNLAVEVGIGARSTVGLLAGYNPWNRKGTATDNRKLVHVMVVPEYRYWTCERFNGHFFGAHLLYAKYNVGEVDIPSLFKKEFRQEGYAAGGGLLYGYHLPLSTAWGVEFTVGVGVAYLDYEKYDCATCGVSLGKESKTYFGPTRAGISLVYILK